MFKKYLGTSRGKNTNIHKLMNEQNVVYPQNGMKF